jgi:hypothetical protein
VKIWHRRMDTHLGEWPRLLFDPPQRPSPAGEAVVVQSGTWGAGLSSRGLRDGDDEVPRPWPHADLETMEAAADHFERFLLAKVQLRETERFLTAAIDAETIMLARRLRKRALVPLPPEMRRTGALNGSR